MARAQVTYWREIPLLVRAWDGMEEVTVPLSPRFQDLVDRVAMLEGRVAADAYLAEWRTGPEEDHSGTPREVAQRLAGAFEAAFERLRQEVLPGLAG